MNLKKRIEVLERKFSDGEITLRMPNGSTRHIRARRLIQMIPEIMGGGPLSIDTRAVIDCVADNCKAVGEGRLTELLKVLYAARADAPQIATVDLEKLSDEELAQLEHICCKFTAEPKALQ